MSIKVKAHEVIAQRIQAVQPLVSGGQMVSPDAGLTLILENESKQRWLAEQDAVVPKTGDWFVQDAELRSSYTVTDATFKKLFRSGA